MVSQLSTASFQMLLYRKEITYSLVHVVSHRVNVSQQKLSGKYILLVGVPECSVMYWY